MFTGLIEGIARVRRVEPRGGLVRLELELGVLADGVRVGDSVALDGTCLTAVEVTGPLCAFEAIPETLARTTLGDWRGGTRVNVERSLCLGDRLGGHIVQGHVDGTATIVERRDGRGETRLRVSTPLAAQMVEKGSVALDGVSLTIAEVAQGALAVALIPHTLAVTTLGDKREGDRVNVEVDVLAKWFRRLAEPYLRGPAPGGGAGPTLDDLARAGF